MADVRNPLVVLLHAGAANEATPLPSGVSRGLTDDGRFVKYSIDLLAECPEMPKYPQLRMLQSLP